MDPSSAQHHHQEMSSNNNTLENMLVCSKSQQDPKKARPQPEQALKCPRCDSINTKFCYYNNYSLSQPRYFCKSCRRYWTKGGTLRNVPVGGGCRKNKRSSSSSSSSAKRSQDHQPLVTTSPLSHLTYDSSDLTLAFARLQKQSAGAQLGFDQSTEHEHFSMMGMNNPVAPAGNFLDALRYQNQNPNNFQNLYYGYGQGGDEQVENGSASCGGEMVIPFGDQMVSTSSGGGTGVTVTTMKQDVVCNNGISSGSREGTENRILWGFPWQLNGEVQSSNSNNMGDVADLGREMWNGLTPSWHGLLNSPLM